MKGAGGSYTLCAAPTCHNNSKKCPELSFFRFPSPNNEHNEERAKRWRINSRGANLDHLTLKQLNCRKLCADHFEDDQFMNSKKNKLIWSAIPTIFDFPNPPDKFTLVRAPCKKRLKVEGKDMSAEESSIFFLSEETFDEEVSRKGDTPRKTALKKQMEDDSLCFLSEETFEEEVSRKGDTPRNTTLKCTKGSYTLCAAPTCHNNSKKCPELSFFRFPSPNNEHNEERAKRWRINSRGANLDHLTLKQLCCRRLCADHFEDDQFMNSKKNKLIWSAIPTIFDFPNPPDKFTPVCAPGKKRLKVERKDMSAEESSIFFLSEETFVEEVPRKGDTPRKTALKKQMEDDNQHILPESKSIHFFEKTFHSTM